MAMSHRHRRHAAAAAGLSLLRVLGPAHVWALGVGIVLVGEFTGWNFSAGKGGALAALIVCWVVGLLYTSVAMIDSEVTSTVAAAGGQYAQAKHIVGPLMAFNVALFLVFAYTMLEVGDAIPVGDLIDTSAAGRARGAQPASLHRPHHRRAGLAQLSRRADDAQLQLRHHRARLPLDRHPVLLGAAVEPGRGAEARRAGHAQNALPYGWIGVIAAFQFGIWYYLGIEGTTQAAEEVRSPARSLPYGTMAGIITLLIAAALTWYVCASLLPWEYLGVTFFPLYDAARVTGSAALESSCSWARCSRRSPRPMAASTTRRAPGSRSAATAICRPGSARCIRTTARPTARSCSCCRSRSPSRSSPAQPGDHLLDPVGRARYTFMSINIVMFRQEMAARLDPARLHAPVPSAAGDRAVRALRGHLLRDLPRLRLAADRHDALLHPGLAVVPLLPLPVRAPRRPVHHAVAEAAGLLSGILFGLFLLTGSGILYAMARRDQQGAALWRAHLMDRIASILPEARVAMRPDGFPALSGRLPDGRRLSMELIADTLVFRRLPQLWLIVTVGGNHGRQRPVDRRAVAPDGGRVLRPGPWPAPAASACRTGPAPPCW